MNLFNLFKSLKPAVPMVPQPEQNPYVYQPTPLVKHAWKKHNPTAQIKIDTVLFVDVSGSVRDEEVKKMVGLVSVDPEKVIYFNTVVNPQYLYGGTDFQCVIDEALRLNLKNIFIFTDTHAPLPKLPSGLVATLIIPAEEKNNKNRDWAGFKVQWV